MTYLLSVFIFPIFAVVLLAGLGCLVALASGRRLLPELVIPAGLAALIVFGQFFAWLGIAKPLNVILMVLLAIVGFVLAIRERSRLWPAPLKRRDLIYPLVAAVAACGVVLATIILNGQASMAGFLLDTTSNVQMGGGDFVLNGSTDFTTLNPAHTDSSMLRAYFGGTSYPFGSQIALAYLGALVGVGLLWVYTPFMAVMVGVSALGLFRVARLLSLERPWAMVAATLAAIPTLVYAFALQGSIKEIVFLPLLILAACLLLDPELRSDTRALAVTGAFTYVALLGAIGLGAVGWVAPFVLATLALGWTKLGGTRTIKETLIAAVVLGGATLIAFIPKLGGLIDEFRLASNLSQSNASLAADPGNLFAPIGKAQGFGTWLGGSHRFPAEFPDATYALIGVIAALFLLGLVVLLRERRYSGLLWVSIMIFVWFALTVRGTMWIDAKLIMISSHVLVLLAVIGAVRLQLFGEGERSTITARITQRAPAYFGVAAIAIGVLGSAGLQFFSTGMLPGDRYKELETIAEKFDGQGPAYTPDFDENALFQLRSIGANGPGYAYTDLKYKFDIDGNNVGYGSTVDLDRVSERNYKSYPLIISRRGPTRSRPGSDYRLASSGDFYDVYKRDTGIEVVEHLPLGAVLAVDEPKCSDVRKLAERALADDSLTLRAALPATQFQAFPRDELDFEGKVAQKSEDGLIVGSGTISFAADITEDQELWWIGTVTRPTAVLANGESAGELVNGLGGSGNVVGPVPLPSGDAKVTLTRSGVTPQPGTRLPATLEAIVLAPATPSEVIAIDPEKAEDELCGSQVDWVELTTD